MNAPAAERDAPGYLRARGAARYAAHSERGLRLLVKRGRLPCYKLGARCVLYRIADLDAYIARFRIGPSVGAEKGGDE